MVGGSSAGRVTGIRFTSPNGTYGIGDTIEVEVRASRPYYTQNDDNHVLTQHSKVKLETGDVDRFATYHSADNRNAYYRYTVQTNDTSDDLDYHSVNATHFKALGHFPTFSNEVGSGEGPGVACTLPVPGETGSLSQTGDIIVDGIVPFVANVTVSHPAGGYRLGESVEFNATFSEKVKFTGDAPALWLDLGAGKFRSANYTEGNNTNILTFAYQVKSGDDAADVDYNGTDALTTAGELTDLAGNNASLTLSASGSLGRTGAAVVPIVASPRPQVSVVSVTSTTGPGSYGINTPIDVRVTFSGTVVVAGGPPLIALDTGAAGRYAEYGTTVNSGRTLVFSYTVRQGDNTDDLDYNTTAVILPNGGTIRSGMLGYNVNLTLPNPAVEPGLLGNAGAVRLDTTAPTVDSVSSTTGPGTYPIGSSIGVRVTFNEDVTVDETGGKPSIALATGAAGRYAEYDASASSARILAFSYTVTEGDDTPDLDYNATAVIMRNGGTIRDTAGNDASLTLPLPGTDGLLGSTGMIRLEAVRPTVDSVSSTTDPGTYPIGSPIDVRVTFDEDVVVDDSGGKPSIALATGVAGRHAEYDAAASTPPRTLVFSYNVTEGDDTDNLDYSATEIALPSGTTIRDAAGNDADRMLPPPGTDGLLGLSGTIVLEAIRPTVESVSTPNNTASYPLDSVIEVRVEFSENVTVYGTAGGGLPHILLDTGGTDRRAELAAGSNNSDTLAFLYTVQASDATADLNYRGEDSLQLGGAGSAIRDAAGNDADRRLPATTDERSLGGLRDIGVDTEPPAVLSAEAEFLDSIRVTFDGPVASGSTNASAGWSISGPSAGGLSVADRGPIAPGSALTELVLSLDGPLPDTAPDIKLSYNSSQGGIRDEAGNPLGGRADIVVADRIRPSVDEALITGPRQVTIEYTENVTASQGAYSNLDIGGVVRTLDPHDAASALRQHVIGFAGAVAPVPVPSSFITIDGRQVQDGAGNMLGGAPSAVEVRNGRVLEVFSSKITGPDTAVIAYTRNAAAERDAYSSLVVAGVPRDITGLDGGGGGGHFHTLTFSPGGAPANATGSVDINGTAVSSGSDMRLGNVTIERTLADGQSPSVRSATAVSLDTIRVLFSEPVLSPGAGAGGWSLSGRDAAGLDVASSQDVTEPSISLTLTLSAALPDAAPDAVTLSYHPAGGVVGDAAANMLVAAATSVRDGIVPEVRSAVVSGPNTAVVHYTEPMRAAPGAYASVALSSGGDPRPVADFEGNDTAVHTVSFGGDPAGPDAAGMLAVDDAAVRDAAGHALGVGGEIALSDGQSPSVRSATAVSLDTIRVLFSEPVLSPGAGAGGWSLSGIDAAGLDVASSQDVTEPSISLALTLSAALPDAAPDEVALLYDPAAGGIEDPAGNPLAAPPPTDVRDGIAPRVASAYIAGPSTAEIRYTERVWASPGAYVSVELSSGGDPLPVAGLEGNGTALHRISFEGGAAAGRGAIGMLVMDVQAVRDAAQNPLDATSPLPLVDSAPPSVRSATAVSLDAIRVLFSEPVLSPGAGAGGWSLSGPDAAGLAVASSQDAAEASDSLVLTLDGRLPDTAPDAVLLYDPAAGSVEDAAGNGLGSVRVPLGDGIAPGVRSAFVAGSSAAEIRYTEPVWAAPGAYASVALSSGGGQRAVTGLAGNGTAAHTVSFGGDPAGQGATGVLEMDETAVLDAAGLALGPNAMLLQPLAGEAPQEGNASARAAFTARNTVTITYSAALDAPEGHAGPVYSAVRIDGDAGGSAAGGTRAVSGVAGLGSAVHTVAFGGDGAGRNQTGTIVLAVDLEGADGGPPRFAAGEIPVASGRTVQAVLLTQPRAPPVPIEPDGFARTIDGTVAGDAARLAINVTALAAASAAPGTVTFPAEAVTLAASFAEVTFPPGATARSVPSGGAFYLYADDDRPLGENGTAALGYANSGALVLRTVVEAGGADGDRIEFDRPVRVSLDGQAGGRAFYIEGADGAITPIDRACAADDTERVHRQLGGSGECRIESGDGNDMVIHTYHLTRFGTVASERGTPPPVMHTCSLRLGYADLAVRVEPGGRSDAAEQAAVNSGSQPFARVDLAATPWYVDPASDMPGPNATSLPANRTAMSTAGSSAGFAPLPAGGAVAVAHGLGGGLESPLWFVLDLAGHSLEPGTELVQRITYTAECSSAE